MNPLYTIWFKPRETFQYLASLNIKESKIGLLILLIALTLSPPSILKIAKDMDVSGVFGYMLGGLFGILLIYLLIRHFISLVFWGISKLLNGNATLNQTRIVVAYSMIPYFIYLFIMLFFLTTAIMSGNFEILIPQHPLIRGIISILFLRNLVYGLSAINNFSYGYAMLTAFIPVIIIEVIVFI